MDIRTLSLFQHLAYSLHFTRTAEAMYVSPSTLSRTIQRLEEECGATLFIRDNRSVKLTAIGKQVLLFCDQFLDEWRRLQQNINEQNTALHGELSLFCSVTASFSHMPGLLDSFTTQYPQVDIKLFTGDPAEAERRVLAQQADIAIAIHRPDYPNELAFMEIDEIPLVLITPINAPETRWEQIDWSQAPVVLPESGPSKRIAHDWFSSQKIKPNVYANVAGNEAIVSMVALGCGFGIVPSVVVEFSVVNNKIKVLEIPNIEPYRLGLACLKKRQDEAAIHAFMHRE